MAIQTLFDTGSSYLITPKMDGAIYQSGTEYRDFVCEGVGDEFNLSYTSSSLKVSFSAGSEACIGGAFFKINSAETITLPASSVIYLCATIKTSDAAGDTGKFTQRTSSNIVKENLMGSGSTRDMLLYIVTTNGTGVTNVVDKRVYPIKSVILSEFEYDAISDKDPHTIYYIYEE